MKYRHCLTLLVFCLIIPGCRNRDFRTETFILQDSTTIIGIDLPAELDTFYTWIDHDDTHCGFDRKYRFSNSDYPIFQESGFFYASYPDSSYRLTFTHSAHLECDESPWSVDLDDMIKGLQVQAEADDIEFIVYSSEHKKIDNTDFHTLRFRTDLVPKQAYPSTLIRSFFRVNNINVKVEFECASKGCDKFLARMNRSLESITVTTKR